MKCFLFLLPLLGLAAAVEKCQCPQVKCPGEPAGALCQCLNAAETKCAEICPDYTPLIRPCPIDPPLPTKSIKPTSTKSVKPTPTPTGKCTCETVYCPMVWPQSCLCENAGKKKCFEKCGGPEPKYETCEIPTLTALPTPTPKPSHSVCGGGRGQQHLTCADGEVCIPAPGTCGPPCDGYGVCVKDKLCGGIAAFSCPKGLQCIDDPRDECDPKSGGADCGGLCY